MSTPFTIKYRVFSLLSALCHISRELALASLRQPGPLPPWLGIGPGLVHCFSFVFLFAFRGAFLRFRPEFFSASSGGPLGDIGQEIRPG